MRRPNASAVLCEDVEATDGPGRAQVHETTHGTTVANLGFKDVAFPAPVFAGDTISARTTVASSRRSKSRPSQGVVEFKHEAFNQRGALVAACTRSALMMARPL